MDQGGYGGAFGGAKAGGAPDPLTFVKRPIVTLRICTLVSLSIKAKKPADHMTLERDNNDASRGWSDNWVLGPSQHHSKMSFSYSFLPSSFLAASRRRDGSFSK